MPVDVLAVLDDDGNEVVLDDEEAGSLLALTEGLEAATVSACPGCHSRILASVALVDVLEAAAPHARSADLIELADDAPTLHLYVRDLVTRCRHHTWRDPGALEWQEALEDLLGEPRGLR